MNASGGQPMRQIFAPTACYLADVSTFYSKWLKDLAAEQTPDGNVQDVVPNVRKGNGASGWGDAATVIPWVLYHEYDDKVMLETQYQSHERLGEVSKIPG